METKLWTGNIKAFVVIYTMFTLYYFNTASGQDMRTPAVNPANFIPAADFEVQINNKNVLVYASPVPADFCTFSTNYPAQVTIKSLKRDVKWVDVRPLHSGVIPVFGNSDSIIHVTILKPGQYSVELNGGIKIPLFLFANVSETVIPVRPDTNVLSFRKGEIYYPGTIMLSDNKKIFIEEGAIVVGSIKARNARHIKIYGNGILDGSYGRKFMDSLAIANHTNNNFALGKNEEGNGLIYLNNCKDVDIEDITIYNSKGWDVVPVRCTNVRVSNIKIISDNGGDDGIDVVSSNNISISNSFIRTKDDCIAIKSFAGRQQPVLNPVRPISEAILPAGPFDGVDSVIVKNCVFWNGLWGNALEIGFELSGDITNIHFVNNDIIHVEGGAAFSIHNARRGVVSNVEVDDLRVEGTDQKLFDVSIFRSIYSEDGLKEEAEINKIYLRGIWDNVLTVPDGQKESRSKFRGYIKNITLKNVQVVQGPFPFSVFYGADRSHQPANIVIENLRVYGQKITSLAEAKVYQENVSDIIIK